MIKAEWIRRVSKWLRCEWAEGEVRRVDKRHGELIGMSGIDG